MPCMVKAVDQVTRFSLWTGTGKDSLRYRKQFRCSAVHKSSIMSSRQDHSAHVRRRGWWRTCRGSRGINITSERKSEAHTAVASVEPDSLLLLARSSTRDSDAVEDSAKISVHEAKSLGKVRACPMHGRMMTTLHASVARKTEDEALQNVTTYNSVFKPNCDATNETWPAHLVLAFCAIAWEPGIAGMTRRPPNTLRAVTRNCRNFD